MSSVSIWLVLVLIAAAFLPTLVASVKRHHNDAAIIVLNVLSLVPFAAGVIIIPTAATTGVVGSILGTGVGMQTLGAGFLMWSAAMVWACTVVRNDLKPEFQREFRKDAPAKRTASPFRIRPKGE
jgi:hypothetical protein